MQLISLILSLSFWYFFCFLQFFFIAFSLLFCLLFDYFLWFYFISFVISYESSFYYFCVCIGVYSIQLCYHSISSSSFFIITKNILLKDKIYRSFQTSHTKWSQAFSWRGDSTLDSKVTVFLVRAVISV